MAGYRSKTACVVDNGLFVNLAVTLAESFGQVFYWSPWENAFPVSNTRLIGQNVPGVTRINSIWEVIDGVDLFVFPDVNYGSLQVQLVAMGKRVWGSRLGEELELDRVASKRYCEEAGIDIGPYQVVTGLAALREYLRENDNQFVKVSRTRGDCETFRAPNYKLIEPRLDELEWVLGAKKNIMEFVVEAAIEDAVETGYDGFSIDGKFAKQSMFGIEIKDCGYVGECLPYRELPPALIDINDKLSPALRDFEYRGFFHTEVRVTGDKAYLVDPCARLGSPPGELMMLLITNLADIIWEGAEGTVVEPEFAARFGAQVFLTSEWAGRNWLAVDFPDPVRDFVKLRTFTIIDDRYYVVPQPFGSGTDSGMGTAIGALVAVADTLDGVIAKVRSYADQVSGYKVTAHLDALDEAEAKYEKVKQMFPAAVDHRVEFRPGARARSAALFASAPGPVRRPGYRVTRERPASVRAKILQ